MRLGPEHFPFPCSLRELVLDRYADPVGSASPDGHYMAMDDLLDYLAKTDNFDISPWASIQAQTEAIGDPAHLSPDQVGVMKWLGTALEHWERDYPIEEPLAAVLRRLKPLCAAMALLDPKFLIPGAHPLHRLLDAVQARAVGWQSTLDRVGALFEQQAARAVMESRDWFDDNNADLDAVFATFAKSVERDASRADRMVLRVIDTELGKVKTQAAKLDAERMINAAISEFEVPPEIDDFIKGPWYASAQLLLLKHGSDSEQWKRMSETTETLLDSLQGLEEAEEERRQYIFQVVTQLPRDMRRWLLSLHHDTEAVNEAMGQVEYTHLRILRRQPVELVKLAPIAIEGDSSASTEPGSDEDSGLEQGQWFMIRQGKGKPLRAQLALVAPATGNMLFTNLAGIKVLQLSRTEFNALLDSGEAVPLARGESFSRSLAKAAGIESAELLSALEEALGAIQAGGSVKPAPEASTEVASQEHPDLPTTAQEAPEAVIKPELAPSEPATEAFDESDGDDSFEPLLASSAPSASLAPTELPELEQQRTDPIETTGAMKEVAELPQEEIGVLTRGFSPELAHGAGFLLEQAQELRSQQAAPNMAEEVIEITPVHPYQQPLEDHAVEEPAPSAAAEPPADDGVREIKLPMGTWLGFHDEETPVMGRLAVHDPDEDIYVFVNRKGFKLRSLTQAQLLELIDNGLVDILQRSSNLREQVVEVRNSIDPGNKD